MVMEEIIDMCFCRTTFEMILSVDNNWKRSLKDAFLIDQVLKENVMVFLDESNFTKKSNYPQLIDMISFPTLLPQS